VLIRLGPFGAWLKFLARCPQAKTPFHYYSGNSAGSINTTFCAAGAASLQETADQLCQLWSQLEPQMVYKTDFVTHSRIGYQWIRDLSLGSLARKKTVKELLDISPLGDLLKNNIDFENLEKKITAGDLLGVSCSAYSYNEQKSIAFFQPLRR
jgi:NTE family protein